MLRRQLKYPTCLLLRFPQPELFGYFRLTANKDYFMTASKGKTIGFWLLTVLVVVSQGASGIADLLHAQGLLDGVTALGYPSYILTILGPFKILGVIVLAIPGCLRLKEWAYAGFFFDFSGASLSHYYNGDSVDLILPSFIAILVLLGSYLLRPESRRLPGPLV
jgi:hypothetical protein